MRKFAILRDFSTWRDSKKFSMGRQDQSLTMVTIIQPCNAEIIFLFLKTFIPHSKCWIWKSLLYVLIVFFFSKPGSLVMNCSGMTTISSSVKCSRPFQKPSGFELTLKHSGSWGCQTSPWLSYHIDPVPKKKTRQSNSC